MSEQKNIDKLFKEQFKDFEVMPDDAIWKNIEHELHKDKRKRRLIPIWWRMAGVAAVLALLFTIGNGILNDRNSGAVNNSIVDTKSNTDSNASEGRNASNDKNGSENEHGVNASDENDFSSENNTQEAIANTEVSTKNSENGLNASEGRNGSNDKNASENERNVNASDQRNFTSEAKTQEALANTEINAENSENGLNASEAASNGKNLTSEESKNRTAVVSKTERNNENEVLANASEEKDGKTKNRSNSEDAVAQQNKLQQEKETLKGKTKVENEALAQNPNIPASKATPNSENPTIDGADSKTLISDPNAATKIRIAEQVSEGKNNSETQLDSLANKEENAIETAIAMTNDTEAIEKEEEEKLNRWSVSPNVAPVYFNSLGKNGSTLDAQFVNNNKEGDVNMSYGITGSYAINKKLRIRAGMNKVDLGYRTNNVIVYDGANTLGRSAQPMSNVKLNSSKSNFISAKNISFATAPDILFSKEQASLDQNLGFIEVPIEIEYSILDSKLGLNIIGGFSTLFLNTNEIFTVENSGSKTFMGEATNVNDLSYSANFGIGVDYKLSKKLKLNLEPTFKYQLNTFSDTSGDFKPFFIGVYTGLSFKF